jgi:hypothetical protein
MEKRKTFRFLILTVFVLVISSAVLKADWITDNAYQFKINVPSNWGVSSYMEGTDKVHEFTSPDENIFIQLRCFDNGGLDASYLAELFDEGLIAEGSTQVSLTNEQLNGLPGVMGVYTNNYEGTDMGIITFTAVNDNLGYLMFIVVPVEQFEQKADEAYRVLNTFTLLSASSSNNEEEQNYREDEKSKDGFGGLRGSTSQQSSGLKGNTGGGQNYVKISGPRINGTYNFSSSGSYPIKNQQTVVIRGLDENGRNALEIYFYNNRGTGTFDYGGAEDGTARFVLPVVDGKAVSKDCYTGSGELTITEYREGGMVKGHFTAWLEGHDIEGSFSLQLSTPKMPGGY